MDPVVVDGGNLFFYRRQLREIETEQLLFKARVVVESYNEIGVAAVALGPYDFAAGFDALRALERVADFPFLCANLLDRATGEPLFPPYVIVTAGGRKIGLLGVLDTSSPIDGLEPLRQRVRLDAPFATVKRYAEALRAEGCELVVVLSASEPKRFRVMANNIPEVDVYVAGDPEDRLKIPWRIGNALVANATQLGKYLGHLRVSWGRDGRPGFRNNFVPMQPDDPDDPVVRRLVDGYYAHTAMVRLQEPERYLREEEERVNLEQGRPIFVGAPACGECHPAQAAQWSGTGHARAYQSLSPEDRRRAECLECHVTGFGAPGGFGSGPDLQGVQCEACHGPGSLHPALRIGRVRRAVEAACRGCHTSTRSPGFNLPAAWEQVSHDTPRERRQEAGRPQ
ncbi:MAG: multiheme c-type cytochrome [Deferrisomatales bacterium]